MTTTSRQARNSRFQQGTGMFACESCGRQTRHTGTQSSGSKCCDNCYELAGFQNSIWDNGVEGLTAGDWAEVRRLWAVVCEKGSRERGIQGIEELITELEKLDAPTKAPTKATLLTLRYNKSGTVTAYMDGKKTAVLPDHEAVTAYVEGAVRAGARRGRDQHR